MSYAGIISRDLIDKNIDASVNVGWSPIVPRIRYSEKEKRIVHSLGIDYISELDHIENIVFYQGTSDIHERFNKEAYELLLKWHNVIQKRLNSLLLLKRKTKFHGTRMSIDTSLIEIERAHQSLRHILSAGWEYSASAKAGEGMEDDFDQIFAMEMLERLLEYAKKVSNPMIIKDIIYDMKYLSAMILGCKNKEGDYACSLVQYIDLLKKINLQYLKQECPECCIEIMFNEYQFCLGCGKKVRS